MNFDITAVQPDSAAALPPVVATPVTPREFARETINACFELFWTKHGKNIQVAVFSFRLKEEIPEAQMNKTVQAAMQMVQQEISRIAGKTEFIWLRKEDTLGRYPTPVFDAVFMGIGSVFYLSGKKYSKMLSRLLLTRSNACCDGVVLHTPPGNLGPGSMTIRSSWDNVDIGRKWLDALTEPFGTGFIVSAFGCSKKRSLFERKKEVVRSIDSERKKGGRRNSSRH